MTLLAGNPLRVYGLVAGLTVAQAPVPTGRHCRVYPLAGPTLFQVIVALLLLTLFTERPDGAVQEDAGAQETDRQAALPISVRILLPGKGPNPLLKLMP